MVNSVAVSPCMQSYLVGRSPGSVSLDVTVNSLNSVMVFNFVLKVLISWLRVNSGLKSSSKIIVFNMNRRYY